MGDAAARRHTFGCDFPLPFALLLEDFGGAALPRGTSQLGTLPLEHPSVQLWLTYCMVFSRTCKCTHNLSSHVRKQIYFTHSLQFLQ